MKPALREITAALILVAAVAGSIVAVPIVAPICFSIFRTMLEPSASVPIPLFGQQADVMLELWGDGANFDGRYELVIKAPDSVKRLKLWSDWGPAQIANFYRSAPNEISVLAAGGRVAEIAVPDDGPPHEIIGSRPATTAEQSDAWTYLGAADGLSGRFYPPDKKPECFDTFGIQSPYRRAFQGGPCWPPS